MVSISIVALATKIIAFGSLGVGVSSVMRLFHNFEWKPSTRKGADTDASELLREKSRKIS